MSSTIEGTLRRELEQLRAEIKAARKRPEKHGGRVTFPDEMKRRIVALANVSTVANVAREIGIQHGMISRWRMQQEIEQMQEERHEGEENDDAGNEEAGEESPDAHEVGAAQESCGRMVAHIAFPSGIVIQIFE